MAVLGFLCVGLATNSQWETDDRNYGILSGMDDADLLFAIALGLAWWGAFALWFLRRAGLFPILARLWRGSPFPARVAAVAAVAALSVYGGSKSGPTNRTDSASSARIPRPSGLRSGGTNQADALRWTAFAIDGDRFDFSVSWPATNLAEYADLDVFHSETLDAPSWRWIRRESVWTEDLSADFSVYGDDLPYWEEVVSQRFRVYTNEVVSPFGITYTNIYARVQSLSPLAPSSGFFMVAGQHDADGDGVSDAVERSLGYDPADPDMDGDGLPDGQELSLGSNPLSLDSDGDGLDDGVEVSWGRASADGLSRWIDTSTATNRIVLLPGSDDGATSLAMPVPLFLFGRTATNLSVNANGLVGVSAGEAPFGDGHWSNDVADGIPADSPHSASVAAFWDDLRVRQDMDSEVSVSSIQRPAGWIAVVEFSHVGFHGGSTNDFVSFQVQFHENETNTAHVVFSETSGRGTGASATLGARSSRDDGVEYSYDEADAAFSGLHVEYHFGCGADPTKADTDGDGLEDSAELTLGTNPCSSDTDGDGLSDAREVARGTNPLLADSDGDGIGDKWECTHLPFNPLDPADGLADSDGDGLSNAFEITRSHTDWNHADTDGDGLLDYAEWNGNTNPQNPDTDGDGLPDGQETTLGTDPCAADTDGDGMPDGWEYQFGFDPLDGNSPAPNADPDSDGLSNLEEAGFGTNPGAADTDGDGLSDGAESGFVSTLPFQPCDMSGATNVLSRVSDLNDGFISIPLPFAIHPTGSAVCTNLVLGIDGILALATDGETWIPSCPTEDRPVVVRAFADDLLAATNELDSALSAATFGTNGARRFVVEYRSFGFYGLETAETNSVSCQVSFAEDEPDVVFVGFFRASQVRSSLSSRALGSNAELSAQSERDYRVFSACEPVAHPGLCIEYHLGTDTSPILADTDGDGLEDDDEFEVGTDPMAPDTDGDGLPDGWEHGHGLDPLNPADGPVDSDGDGLSNVEEYFNETTPGNPDTDGDGVNDGVEVNNGTDPNVPGDGSNPPVPDAFLTLPFHIYGDYAAWEMTVVATSNDTRTFRFATAVPGQSDSRALKLRKGASYEISLHWRGSGEHRNPDWYCWEAQIGSPACPDTQCFDDYDPTRLDGNEVLFGDGWICENADGLLTSHVHTHDGDGGNIAAGKTATLHVLAAGIAKDADRDGEIGESDRSSGGPLRVWINDDDDDGAIATVHSDNPGADEPDYDNTTVDGLSDLVDFFPVHLDLGGAWATLRAIPGLDTNLLEVSLFGDGIELGCVFTDLTAAEAGNHLSDPAAGLSDVPVSIVDSVGLDIPFDWLDSIASNPAKGLILVEGRGNSYGYGSLALAIQYDGAYLLEKSIPVVVAPVEQFYRWYNYRAVVGGTASMATDTSIPPAFPDAASDSNNVVFIHGFSVDEQGARGWNAEMFKRLWQSGCNSKFHAVTWYGNDGVFWNAFDGGDNYHGNVVHAFETAPAFASRFSSLVGETTVLAHSLGNMVVSSAIQDHGFRPDRFFMLNAAVPAEAFDATQWNTAETNNPFEFEDWVGYPANSWASCWHTLFPTNDIRSRLTWKGRFADVPQLTTLYNYYSTGDEVLAIYDTPDPGGSGKITIHPFGLGGKRYHSWQKQERFKGRWLQSALGGFAGTSEMGWGFEAFGNWTNGTPPMYELGDPALPYVTPVRMHAYTIQQASAATSDQLRADPVFNHDPPEILSGNLQTGCIDILLARGVPALSGPVGSVPLIDFPHDRQRNLNIDASAENCPDWPRGFESTWNGWLHSDIKNIAFPFVKPVFINMKGVISQ